MPRDTVATGQGPTDTSAPAHRHGRSDSRASGHPGRWTRQGRGRGAAPVPTAGPAHAPVVAGLGLPILEGHSPTLPWQHVAKGLGDKRADSSFLAWLAVHHHRLLVQHPDMAAELEASVWPEDATAMDLIRVQEQVFGRFLDRIGGRATFQGDKGVLSMTIRCRTEFEESSQYLNLDRALNMAGHDPVLATAIIAAFKALVGCAGLWDASWMLGGYQDHQDLLADDGGYDPVEDRETVETLREEAAWARDRLEELGRLLKVKRRASHKTFLRRWLAVCAERVNDPSWREWLTQVHDLCSCGLTLDDLLEPEDEPEGVRLQELFYVTYGTDNGAFCDYFDHWMDDNYANGGVQWPQVLVVFRSDRPADFLAIQREQERCAVFIEKLLHIAGWYDYPTQEAQHAAA